MTWSYCFHRRYRMSRQKNIILINEHALNREPVPLKNLRWSLGLYTWIELRLIIVYNISSYNQPWAGGWSSYRHSASHSCPILSVNCTFRHILRLFRLFRGDRSDIDKSSSATWLLYNDGVKEDPSPTLLRKYQEEDEEEAVKSLAIKESEIFFFYLFFNYFTLSFFSILFLPTTPSTHTHDPRHLVTLSVLSSFVNNTTGVSQLICVKCQREVLKFLNWKNSGKNVTRP